MAPRGLRLPPRSAVDADRDVGRRDRGGEGRGHVDARTVAAADRGEDTRLGPEQDESRGPESKLGAFCECAKVCCIVSANLCCRANPFGTTGATSMPTGAGRSWEH